MEISLWNPPYSVLHRYADRTESVIIPVTWEAEAMHFHSETRKLTPDWSWIWLKKQLMKLFGRDTGFFYPTEGVQIEDIYWLVFMVSSEWSLFPALSFGATRGQKCPCVYKKYPNLLQIEFPIHIHAPNQYPKTFSTDTQYLISASATVTAYDTIVMSCYRFVSL